MDRPLTHKQGLFVEAYIATGGNATAAAKMAGYAGNDNTLHVAGDRLLRNATIVAAIANRTKATKHAMGADEVLEVLTAHARGDIADVVDHQTGVALPMGMLKQRNLSRLIRKLTTDDKGKTTLELHDAQAAATTLGRYHGLWMDRVIHETVAAEFAGEVAAAVEATVREYASDAEQAQRIIEAIDARLEAVVGIGIRESPAQFDA